MKVWLKDFAVCLLIGLLLVGAFVLLYEPDQCVLCSQPPQDVPCIVSLPAGAVFQFSGCSQEAGCGVSYSLKKVGLPWMDTFSFCRSCRNQLRIYLPQEAALVDLNDPEHRAYYPLTDGAVYNIRSYRITVTASGDGFTIIAEGTLQT